MSIEDYYESAFHVPVELIAEELNLYNIAKQPTKENLMPMLELVMGIAFKSTGNEVYINRMKNLSEDAQKLLIDFIQPVLAKFERLNMTPEDLTKVFLAEKKHFRADFSFLKSELIRTHEELINTHEELEKSVFELTYLRSKLTDLESEISNKVVSYESLFRLEFEAKISAKEEEIRDVRQEFRKAEMKREEIIRKLKDELDLQIERGNRLEEVEKSLEMYKKKLDDQAGLKRQIMELTAVKTDLQTQLKKREETETGFTQLKESTVLLKTQLNLEKEKNLRLQVQLSESATKIADLEQSEQLNCERISLISEKLKELQEEHQLRRDSSIEASLQGDFETEYEEEIKRLASENQALRGNELLIQHYKETLDAAMMEKQQGEARFSIMERKKETLEKELEEVNQQAKTGKLEIAAVLREKIELIERVNGLVEELKDKNASLERLLDVETKLECTKKEAALKLELSEQQVSTLQSEVSRLELQHAEMRGNEVLFVRENESLRKDSPDLSHGQPIPILELELEVDQLTKSVSFLTLRDSAISTMFSERNSALIALIHRIQTTETQYEKMVLGLSFLCLAVLEPLMDLWKLEESTVFTLEGAEGYPWLREILGRMLVLDLGDRPKFRDILDFMNSCLTDTCESPHLDAVMPGDFPTKIDEELYRNPEPKSDKIPDIQVNSMECIESSKGNEEVFSTSLSHRTPEPLSSSSEVCCLICNAKVMNADWQDSVSSNEEFSYAFRKLCSQACFQAFVNSQSQFGKSTCIMCRRDLLLLSQPSLVLQCRHSFHDKTCLLAYLRSATFDFQRNLPKECPLCKWPMDAAYIMNFFGGPRKFYSVVQQYVDYSVCLSCGGRAEVKLPCSHSVCKLCCPLSNRRWICDVCGSIMTR